MRYYEHLFIIDPNVDQERYANLVDSVKKELGTLGGSLIDIDDWGKKRLAYPINKQKYGSYVLLYFETEKIDLVKEFESWMKFTPGILSCMTIKLKSKPEIKEKTE